MRSVGRYANRIADAHFVVDGRAWSLQLNEGPNLLHGGHAGLNHVVWNVKSFEREGVAGAVLRYRSPDGESRLSRHAGRSRRLRAE